MFTKNRIAALVLALTVVLRCYLAKGPQGLSLGFLVCLLSLPFIWFPQEINRITLYLPVGKGQRINRETPGCMVSFMGWSILIFFSILIGVKFGV